MWKICNMKMLMWFVKKILFLLLLIYQMGTNDITGIKYFLFDCSKKRSLLKKRNDFFFETFGNQFWSSLVATTLFDLHFCIWNYKTWILEGDLEVLKKWTRNHHYDDEFSIFSKRVWRRHRINFLFWKMVRKYGNSETSTWKIFEVHVRIRTSPFSI